MIALVLALLFPPAQPEAAPAFRLTQEHINLLRKSTVVWTTVESGAPAVLVSPMEAGGEEVVPAMYDDIAERAGFHVDNPMTDEQRKHIESLIADMPEAFAQILEHGALEPGSYTYDNPLATSPFLSNTLPKELEHLAKPKSVTFKFTSQHALLLRNARWEGMFMNPKRPYGDMTYFDLDIASILNEPVKRDAKGMLSHEQEERLWKLHTETLPALQLYLQKAAIKPGDYPRIDIE